MTVGRACGRDALARASEKKESCGQNFEESLAVAAAPFIRLASRETFEIQPLARKPIAAIVPGQIVALTILIATSNGTRLVSPLTLHKLAEHLCWINGNE
jgi:hypothetical protein